jgi:hypothetical protein
LIAEGFVTLEKSLGDDFDRLPEGFRTSLENRHCGRAEWASQSNFGQRPRSSNGAGRYVPCDIGVKTGYNLFRTWDTITHPREEVNKMFDSLEDQMKAENMEGSRKEKLMRYLVIGAISVVAVTAVFAAVEFLR